MISVIFRRANGLNPIILKVNNEDKISDIIDRYSAISGDNAVSKKFIFNAKLLPQDLTVEQAGLYLNANIFVVESKKGNPSAI